MTTPTPTTPTPPPSKKHPWRIVIGTLMILAIILALMTAWGWWNAPARRIMRQAEATATTAAKAEEELATVQVVATNAAVLQQEAAEKMKEVHKGWKELTPTSTSTPKPAPTDTPTPDP